MTGIPVAVAELVGVDYLNEVARGHWRKTTAKAVNTTVTATDLLNGEITINAGAMSTSRALRLTAWGDWLNNSGVAAAPPRLVLKLGTTTLLDTNTAGTASASATRFPFRAVAEIMNLGATNVQLAELHAEFGVAGTGADAVAAFTTGEGRYATLGSASACRALGYNAGAIDTTAALALVLQVINGSASASYETKLIGALVEII